MQQHDVDIIIKTEAEIKLVNSLIFKFIQTLSRGQLEQERKQVLIEKLRQIERSLDFKMETARQLKDKFERKEVMRILTDCRERTSNVSSELRKVINLESISN